MPQIEGQVVSVKPMVEVSTLTKFLKSCVELMKDRTVIHTLYDMIDQCKKGRETPIMQRMVSQVLRRKRTNE
jgi:hypothetical protein